MIHFYGDKDDLIYAVQTFQPLSDEDDKKLQWLFGWKEKLDQESVQGYFTGPRATTITPWSTNAVEIAANMEINGINRIEEFRSCTQDSDYDQMLLQKYDRLDQSLYDVDIEAEGVQEIDDIALYNAQEGLALSDDEIDYLNHLSEKLERKLTDSEVFGFSQVNSEHCRHKIFNGKFVIDGEEMESSLFQLIKKTSKENPNEIVSAYSDNVAFVQGTYHPAICTCQPRQGRFLREQKF